MGTYYYYEVNLKLSFDSEQEVIEKLKEAYVDTHLKTYAVFSEPDSDSLSDLVKVLISDEDFEERRIDENTAEFNSGFNASGGWGSVMIDVFSFIAPALKDGSAIQINQRELSE